MNLFTSCLLFIVIGLRLLFSQGDYSVQIKSTWNNLCVTSTSPVSLEECQGSRDHQWKFEKYSENLRIRNSFNQECLTIDRHSKAITTTCKNSKRQLFRIVSKKFLGNEGFQIQSIYYSKCLDVTDWGTDDGTPLQFFHCHPGMNQLFMK